LSGAGANWRQKASTAIGFIKTTEAIRKKPHIPLKKPQFLKNVFERLRNPWKSLNFYKKSSKSLVIFIKSPHFWLLSRFLWKCLQKA
jgi:hypothetical protein